jgi:hypothetical protein
MVREGGAAVNNDRTVHASNHEAEIVRYDRAGKWYIEYRDGDRRRISLRQAAKFACLLYVRDGVILTGKPGGRAFDRAVHQAAFDRAVHEMSP